MATPISLVVTSTDTFQIWVNKTNEMANAFTQVAVTVAATGDGDDVTGNGYVIGILGANGLVANSIHGGNVSTSSNLTITSNLVFNTSNLYVNTDSGAFLYVGNSTVNATVNSTAIDWDADAQLVHTTGKLAVTGGTLDVGEAFQLSGDLTPAQITSNQNDYAPAGHETVAVFRLDTDASRTVTGLAGGVDGRLVVIHNIGGSDLVMTDQDVLSTAGNRFALSNTNVTLPSDQSSMLQYDSTSSRWRIVAGVGSVAGVVGGDDTEIQYNKVGALEGDPGFTFNDTSNTVHIGDGTTNAVINSTSLSFSADVMMTQTSGLLTLGSRLVTTGNVAVNDTTDNASVELMRLVGDKTADTPTDNDEIYLSFYLSHDGASTSKAVHEMARITAVVADVTETSEDSRLDFGCYAAGSFADRVSIAATNIRSSVDGTTDLGLSGTGWGDAFFASGKKLDFDSGDVTVTHTSGTLTFAGATTSGWVFSDGFMDFTAATETRITIGATPTMSTDGALAIDTTVTDFSGGVLKFFDGEEMGVVAMPIAQFTSPTDEFIIAYNATNDEFELVVAPAGGGGGGPSLGANSIIRTNDRTIRENITVQEKLFSSMTIQTTGNTVTVSSHDFANGEIVQFDFATTFPGGVVTETDYYVIETSGDTFQLAATYGGTEIDLTTAGSGANAVWKCINGSSVGPVEVGTSFTVTVANGCTWSVV